MSVSRSSSLSINLAVFVPDYSKLVSGRRLSVCCASRRAHRVVCLIQSPRMRTLITAHARINSLTRLVRSSRAGAIVTVNNKTVYVTLFNTVIQCINIYAYRLHVCISLLLVGVSTGRQHSMPGSMA